MLGDTTKIKTIPHTIKVLFIVVEKEKGGNMSHEICDKETFKDTHKNGVCGRRVEWGGGWDNF